MSEEYARDNEKPEPVADLRVRAADNLTFIRDTMARSSSFTSVPGWGFVVMGSVALIGGCIAVLSDFAWLTVWMFVAAICFCIGITAMGFKAKRNRESLVQGPGRRFLLTFAPPIAAGVMLTDIFFQLDACQFLPATWLLLYGAGCMTGGAFSVRIIPIMGLCFMLFGVTAYLLPGHGADILASSFNGGDICMLAGFGLLHIIFGVFIAIRHGG